MKIRRESILGLVVAFLMMLVWLPSPVQAESNAIPEEIEVTWQITANANYSWSSQSVREKDGKVSARYDGNDSFSLNLSGTTLLTNVSNKWAASPTFRSITDNNKYTRSCQGGGTHTIWSLNELSRWTTEEGFKTKDFESTTVSTWQYHWPGIGHPGASDNPIEWLELIPPQSENEPLRYRICLEPFFFIDYDEYFETTGTYKINGTDWDGSYSESGELGNYVGHNAPSLANQAWYDRVETHPDGGVARGELTFSDGKFRDKGTVQHTFRDENGQSFIQISYEINRKPFAKAIQPNQVLGRYEYRDKDDYDRATHFVAGKDTVVQVFFPDEVKAGQVNNLELDIYRNGNKVATLTGPKKDSKNNALIFVPKDKSTCGNWAAGTYRFVARLEDAEKTLDGVEFKERRDIRILAVPVTANYGGTIKSPGPNWSKADKFLRQVFPLANDNVKLELGEPLDASGSRYNLATDDGCTWLWLKLRDLQPPSYAGGQYDAIVGFIADPIPVYTDGELTAYRLGYTVRKPAAIVALNSDYQTTLAHEFAHFFGVGDEYNSGAFNLVVNPPPPGYQGTDWDTGKPVTSPDSPVKPATSGTGSLISEKLHPYEVGGRELLGDLTSFMGSGAPLSKNWITPVIWKHLYTAFEPQSSTQALRAFASRSGEQYITASGMISSAGQVETMEPWFSNSSGLTFTPETGSHSILALDASGTVLSRQGFTPYFRDWANPPRVMDKAVFTVETPLPVGTSCFQIVEGDRVLHEIPVSTVAPIVDITHPLEGASLSGTVDLAWTASDADGDDLFYKVEYSPDGKRWIVLEPATSSTQFTADFSQLPGGEQAVIRVTATDGINSATAISTWLQSPVKAPEVDIQTPIDGLYLLQGEGVFLEGRAYDPQVGWIYDSTGLVWSSDRDGELGRGSLVFADKLSSGSHIITLQASGPSGQTNTQSVNLTVAPTGTDTPQELGQQSDVPLDYTWTVTFNAPVDPITINPANIRVTDATGSVNINVVPGEDGKSALITPPPGGYLPGQSYIILVNNSIQSAIGKPLKSSYIKRFTTSHGDGTVPVAAWLLVIEQDSFLPSVENIGIPARE